MQSRFAFAVLIAAASASNATAGEDLAGILKHALRLQACAVADAAQGWETHRVSPVSTLTGVASDSLTIVDRSRRRFVSRIRMSAPDTPDAWRVQRLAYADGRFYACSAENAETCKLEPKPDDAVTPEDVTGAYVIFSDLRSADFGGAKLTAAEIPAEIAGATTAITLTLQGGAPYTIYIGADDRILATDLKGSDRTQRYWMGEDGEMSGCVQPLSARIEILPAFAGRYIEWRLESVDYRAAMSPEDTAFE